MGITSRQGHCMAKRTEAEAVHLPLRSQRSEAPDHRNCDIVIRFGQILGDVFRDSDQ